MEQPITKYTYWRHTSDIDSKLTYTRIQEIVDDGNFIISETNNDNSLLNTEVKIILNNICGYTPPESSQHIVFFGSMILPNKQEISICIKFKKPDNVHSKEDSEYGNYTQKHSSYVLYNYSKALNYLKRFDKKDKISIVDIFCCNTVKKYKTKCSNQEESLCFWIEAKLDHFDTFWDKSRSTYIEQIITTDIEVLKEFQIFIYNESGYEYTIIDLQGDKHDGKYILCDIEFTTNNLYEFTPIMMSETICSLYNLNKTNLTILESSIKELSLDVAGVKSEVKNISNRITGIEDMLKILINK
jgi:hypothetical protein